MEYKKISDLFEIISGGTPKRNIKKYWSGNIPWISIKDFNDDYRFLDKTEEYITDKGFDNSSTNLLLNNDLIISARGTVGKLNMIRRPMAFNQSCYGLRPKKNIYPDYGYYVIKNIIRNIVSQAYGSVFSTITKRNFDDIKIPIFEYKKQIKISNILCSLDNKIENNNKIISNLESQSQAIFKSWFVDFEPFKYGKFTESELGMIPEGWKVVELLDLVDFIGGSQPPKSEHIYENKEGYVRFIQNRDYNLSDSHLTYIKKSKRNKYADSKDILMDKYGEAGKVRYGISGAFNVALAKIEPYDVAHREYIRRFLEQYHIEQYIYNSSIASTRPSVSKNTLVNLKLALPDERTIDNFSKISNSFIEIILNIRKENNKLSKLRDTLLPKLMSGEIRLEED